MRSSPPKPSALSIPKYGESVINEDAVILKDNIAAISDGAGGGGLYADKWSKYLVSKLPNTPIQNFQEFDQWIDSIWEEFYVFCEKLAKQAGSLFLNKFYDEGAFATIAIVWKQGCHIFWTSYGDTVIFKYSYSSKVLKWYGYSVERFELPPYLVGCIFPLNDVGFSCGQEQITPNDEIVFIASDALAWYIIYMYMLENITEYKDTIQNIIDSHTKTSNYISTALKLKKISFEKSVISKLISCSKNSANFKRHLYSLERKHLIANDDYSLIIL
jgi:hypothetical protein